MLASTSEFPVFPDTILEEPRDAGSLIEPFPLYSCLHKQFRSVFASYEAEKLPPKELKKSQ